VRVIGYAFSTIHLGAQGLVGSDHAALSYLRRTKDPVAQQARWLDFIEQFDITVRHRSGSAHPAADAPSRKPCEGLVRVISATGGQEPLLWNQRSSTRIGEMLLS